MRRGGTGTAKKWLRCPGFDFCGYLGEMFCAHGFAVFCVRAGFLLQETCVHDTILTRKGTMCPHFNLCASRHRESGHNLNVSQLLEFKPSVWSHSYLKGDFAGYIQKGMFCRHCCSKEKKIRRKRRWGLFEGVLLDIKRSIVTVR